MEMIQYISSEFCLYTKRSNYLQQGVEPGELGESMNPGSKQGPFLIIFDSSFKQGLKLFRRKRSIEGYILHNACKLH